MASNQKQVTDMHIALARHEILKTATSELRAIIECEARTIYATYSRHSKQVPKVEVSWEDLPENIQSLWIAAVATTMATWNPNLTR
jgi:hypothetical protein